MQHMGGGRPQERVYGTIVRWGLHMKLFRKGLVLNMSMGKNCIKVLRQ